MGMTRSPRTILDFLDYKVHVGHSEFSFFQILAFGFVITYLLIAENKLWFVVLAVGIHQVVFHFSKHVFHHYFDLHIELEILFIAMVVASYHFGIIYGLILAILGTVLFKGQIPLECTFTTFRHDIPNRILIACMVFILKWFFSLSTTGLIVTVLYYVVLHSLHELKHHHIPIFEIPTIISNLLLGLFFFEVLIGMIY